MASRKQEFYMSIKAILDKTELKNDAKKLQDLLSNQTIDFDSADFKKAVRKVVNEMSKETLSSIMHSFNAAVKSFGKEIDIDELLGKPNLQMWEGFGDKAGKFFAEGLTDAINNAIKSIDWSGAMSGLDLGLKKQVDELKKQRRDLESELGDLEAGLKNLYGRQKTRANKSQHFDGIAREEDNPYFLSKAKKTKQINTTPTDEYISHFNTLVDKIKLAKNDYIQSVEEMKKADKGSAQYNAATIIANEKLRELQTLREALVDTDKFIHGTLFKQRKSESDKYAWGTMGTDKYSKEKDEEMLANLERIRSLQIPKEIEDTLIKRGSEYILDNDDVHMVTEAFVELDEQITKTGNRIDEIKGKLKELDSEINSLGGSTEPDSSLATPKKRGRPKKIDKATQDDVRVASELTNVEENVAKATSQAADDAERQTKAVEATLQAETKLQKLLLYRIGKTTFNPNRFRNTDMMGNSVEARMHDFGGYGDGLFAVVEDAALDIIKSDIAPNDPESYFEFDASKYNLYFNKTVEQANALSDFSNKLQKFILAAGDFRGFDDDIQGINEESLFAEATRVFGQINMSQEEFTAWITSMKQLVQANGLDSKGKFSKADESFLNSRNFFTRFMQTQGYQGVINQTGDDDIDGMYQGSVIYEPDFKEITEYIQSNEVAFKKVKDFLLYLTGSKERVNEIITYLNETPFNKKNPIELFDDEIDANSIANVAPDEKIDDGQKKVETQEKIKHLNQVILNAQNWIDYLDEVLDDNNFKTSGKKEATEQLRDAATRLRDFRENPQNYANWDYAEEKINVRYQKAFEEAKKQGVAESVLNKYDNSHVMAAAEDDLKRLQKARDLRVEILANSKEELKLLQQTQQEEQKISTEPDTVVTNDQVAETKSETEAIEQQNEVLKENLSLKQMVEQASQHGIPGQSVAEAAGAVGGTVGANMQELQNILSNITYKVQIVQKHDAPDSDKKAALIDIEALKQALGQITYNTKLVKDDADKTANKIALDDSSLEATLNRVFANILRPATEQNDGKTQGAWALESTLQTVKGVLESINKKIVQGTKVIRTGDKKEAEEKKSGKPEIKKATDDGFVKATKVDGRVKSLESDYARLGKLQADFAEEGSAETAEEIRQLQELIDHKKAELKLEQDKQAALDATLEKRRAEAEQAEKAILAAREADKVAKQKVKDDKAALRAEMKDIRDKSRISKATSTWRSGKDVHGLTMNMVDESQGISIDDVINHPDVAKLYDELNNITQVQERVNNQIKANKAVSEEDAIALQKQTAATQQQIKTVKELQKNYEFFSGDNSASLGQTYAGGDLETQLKQAIMLATNGKAKFHEYNAALGQWTYSVVGANNETKNYTAGLRGLDKQFRTVHTSTKKTESLFESIKRKTKEVFTYFSGSSMVYKAFGELRKGIQYIREIDSALTELKKVTDETEETYDKFLDTAAKTAEKVGSTIKEIVSSTADFARLGYSLKEAAVFAESAQILMNVSEFTDISRATDTLISAVQAFGYTAETSMEVVDLLNTIGNNYAISTADLAQSLTKSSASLVAAGGNLAEAAALTATANKIIQDADSVGTALKTTSLRLRGTSVDILNEEGLDSEGAVTSKSKLQSKVKALSGVDILTATGEYKSTYEILSQIANVWEDINDMDQAALLELISGKRNSSVIAAILQNPAELKEAFEDAQNAEGSALRENEKYLDSIQGRIDLFTNAVQTMWQNTLNSDVVKWFVNLGTTIVKIIDKLGLIPSLLIAIGAYKGFGGLFKSLADGGVTIQSLTKKLWAYLTGVQTTAAAEVKLTQAQLATKLARQGLNDTTIKSIIAETGLGVSTDKLSRETLEATMTTLGYSEAQKQATISRIFGTQATVAATLKEKLLRAEWIKSLAVQYLRQKADKAGIKISDETIKKYVEQLSTTKLLKTAAKELWATTKTVLKNIAPLALAAVAIWGITKAVDALFKTTEELQEEYDELNNTLSETKSKLSDLESELSTINDKIKEINSQDSLSFTDQEELSRLKAQRAELKRQIDLNKTLQKQQQVQMNESALNMANDYADVGRRTGKTTAELAEGGGKIGAVAGGVIGGVALGAKLGTAIGTIVPGIGNLIGLAAGALIGAIGGALVGAAGGAVIGAIEEDVGDSLDNMKEEHEKLQENFNKARDKYNKDPSKKNKKKFDQAQEALQDYEAATADYLSKLDAYYSQMDWETATTEQKKAMQEFYDTQDKWAIQSGGTNAKSNAISRLFGDTASTDIKAVKTNIEKAMKEAADSGTSPIFDFATAFNSDKMAEFKQRLYDIGLTVTDVKYYFLDLAKAEKEAEDSYTTYDTVKQINSLTGGINALKDAFGEITEEGYVSTETLVELEETFGSLGDSWKAFVDIVATGTGSIKEATDAINELLEAYLTDQLASGPMTAEEELKTIMLLQQLGVKNAKEYIDAMQKASAMQAVANNIVKDDEEEVELKAKIDGGTATDEDVNRYKELNSKSYEQYIKEIEDVYEIDLTEEEERLLLEKAITAEKAKQDALRKQEQKTAYETAVREKETAEEKNANIDNQIKAIDETSLSELGVTTSRSNLGKGQSKTKYHYNGKVYYSESAVRQAIKDELEASKAEVPELPVEITEADVINADAVAESTQSDLQDAFDSIGLKVNVILADPSDLVDDIQNVFDALADAQKEYEENGYLSVDTLQNLLKLEPKYLDLLVDEEGNLNLTKDALYNVARARIIDMGVQAQKNILESATKLATEGSAEALREEISVMEEASETGTDFVAVQMAKVEALLAERVAAGKLSQEEADAFIKGTMSQIQAVQVATQSALDNLHNSLSSSGNTETGEIEDAFQKAMDYWDNRIEANQAKYDQIQNDIDWLESQGKMADANYYKDQIALMTEGEESKTKLLDNKLAQAAARMRELEAAGQEGSDEWWEAASIYNDTLSELDDVRDTVLELQDAIGEIEWSQFEEFNTRLDDINSKLETMRDLIAPDGEEDWFDDEGNWTEKGVAVLGSYVQDLNDFKNGLAEASKKLEEFQSKEYNAENADWFANNYGIHSEQEYYDYLKKLTDQQYNYATAVSDTEQDIAGMYESSIDAVEEYIGTLVEGYQDYIDVVKESLDAERDLYNFKKDVQKQTKDIASLERRIASLSGSTNAADIAERRKLEAELYESRESLNDTYYEHSMDSRQEALDKEAQAYEEAMNKFVENLRTNLDLALEDMDGFMSGVTAAVTANAPLILEVYKSLGISLDENIVSIWQEAADAIEGYTKEDGLGLMNSWTASGGVFDTFATNATTYLTSIWDDDNVDPSNAFASAVTSKVQGIANSIKSNVETAKGYLTDLYNVADTSANAPSGGGGGGGGGGNGSGVAYSKQVEDLQKIMNFFFGANIDEDGKFGSGTRTAVKNMQKKLGVLNNGVYNQQTYEALMKYLNKMNVGSWFRANGITIPSAMPQYAKGTLGTTEDQWALTDELGDELVLVPGANGNLSFMRKGTSVVPADITTNLVEWGKLNPDMMKVGGGANINMISNAVNKPELNFEFDSLVHVDHCDEGTLKDLEKMVDTKINQFTKRLNYSLKGIGAK